MGLFRGIRWLFKGEGASSKANNPKPLREYTDDELFSFLENNETADVGVLASICSEILRRQDKGEER